MSQTNCSLLLEIDSVIRKSLLVKPKADLKLFSLFIFIPSWKAKYIYILGSGQFSVRFSYLKLRFFGFGILPGLRVFSNLVFGFRVLSTMKAVFRIFLSNAFYCFSGVAKEVTPFSRAKIVIPREHLRGILPFLFRGMDDKLSLLSSRYSGRNGCQEDYEKPKITSTIFKYHTPGILSRGL